MATDKLPADIITPKSLYTITGAAASVWLFGAVLFTVLGDRVDEVIYRAIGFGLSLLIAIGMMVEKKKFGMKYWLLIIPNAALIFINASGFNAVNNGSISTPGVNSDTIKVSWKNIHVAQGRYEARLIPFFNDVNWWPDPLMKQEITRLRIKEDSLEEKNGRLEEKIRMFESAGSLPTQGNDQIQPYVDKIALLEQQLLQLQKDNEDLKTAQGADAGLVSANDRLQRQVNDLRKQLQTKESQLTSANERLKECLNLGQTAGSLNNQITDLNKQVTELKAALARCNSQLAGGAGTNARVAALEDQLKACQNQISTVSGYAARIRELEASQAKCQDLLKQSGSTTNRVSELESQLKNCEALATRYKTQLAECQKNATSSNTLADMKVQLSEAQRSARLCSSQLMAVRDSLQNCVKRLQIRTVSPTNRVPQ